MNKNSKSYKSINQKKLDDLKAEMWMEDGMTLSERRAKAGKMGGKVSVFARFGNKTKAEISEIMKRVRMGKKIKPE